MDQEEARFYLVDVRDTIDPDGDLLFGSHCFLSATRFDINIYIPMAHWQSSFLFFLFFFAYPASALSQAPAHPVYKLQSSPGLTITDQGSWKTVNKGTEFRKLTLQRAEPYQLIDLKMVRFDTRWIVPRVVRSMQHNLKGANVKILAEKSGAIAAINANYFDEKGKPLGFLKVAADEGNLRISKSSLFTGIFGIKDRLPFIMHRDQFSPELADEGLQAGPLLLAKGIALPVIRGAGKQSRRSLIGMDKEQRLIIAVTDSLLGGLTWVELQEIFSSGQWQVQTVDLLNLDGGGSTQLYVKGVQLEEHVVGTTDVPVAIGFFQK
ncbi:phosphodiester glycosidase family protein [bacterium]|nr:MAG: phosphodiester glycosidase family protein [bacterium]